MTKLWHYVVLICLIVGGIVCGSLYITDYTTQSSIIGDGFSTEYETNLENFTYNSTSIVFYENEESSDYEFTTNKDAVDNFDGLKNDYSLTINSNIVNGTWGNGYFLGTQTYIFYDIYGETITEATYTISLKFYVDKTELSLTCEDSEQAEYLSSYFTNYGFKLKIKGE